MVVLCSWIFPIATLKACKSEESIYLIMPIGGCMYVCMYVCRDLRRPVSIWVRCSRVFIPSVVIYVCTFWRMCSSAVGLLLAITTSDALCPPFLSCSLTWCRYGLVKTPSYSCIRVRSCQVPLCSPDRLFNICYLIYLGAFAFAYHQHQTTCLILTSTYIGSYTAIW